MGEVPKPDLQLTSILDLLQLVHKCVLCLLFSFLLIYLFVSPFLRTHFEQHPHTEHAGTDSLLVCCICLIWLFKVISYNVRGPCSPHKCSKLWLELKRLEAQVLFLQETHFTHNSMLKLPTHLYAHPFLHSLVSQLLPYC